ncbi:MAG: choice-of-anchor Q domain-containing protein, partial [Gammaproteobacteria bacterium]
SAVNNTTDSPNGLPSVTSTITLNGNGLTLQRSTVTGTPEFRLLHVADTGNLTLNQITLRNGRAPYVNFYGHSHYGGAVFTFGTVALNYSTVSGNSARVGAGLYNSGTLTLTNSTVSGNSAYGIFNARGGGVANGGTLSLTNTTVSGNSSNGSGGGVYNHSGEATLIDSTVSGNSALGHGGGLLNYAQYDDICSGATLTLRNSTVSGNTAGAHGGGIFHADSTKPYSYCSFLTLTDSTVSDNNAAGRGGGLYNGFDHLTLIRTLVSGNTAPSSPEVHNYTGPYATGTVFADNSNLFGTNGDTGVVGFTPGATDIVPGARVMLAEILDPLADNDGPTQTHALVAGSPAIDASPIDKDCAVTDQRSVFRPQGPACDIGAFEVGFERDPFALPTPTTGCTVNGVPDQLCRGEEGPDRILGTTGNDVILGLRGDDYLNGSSGDNRLFGGEDNDRLIGANGGDLLFGQAGDDDLRGRAGNDLLEGGDGNDRLKGHEGDDRLRGGDGDDALRGLAGQDTLEGGAGSDLLRGGLDFDTLNGGPGADTLNGGGSFDSCTSDAEDTIVVLCE